MKKNTNARIKQYMAQNEADVLAHLRENRVTQTAFFDSAWRNALERLQNAGKVVHRNGAYKVVRTREEIRLETIQRKRAQFLSRIEYKLQSAINEIERANNFFSDHFDGEEFLDNDLENSIQCALDDVEAAQGGGE